MEEMPQCQWPPFWLSVLIWSKDELKGSKSDQLLVSHLGWNENPSS